MNPKARAPRCLKLVTGKHGTNRCESEQVDGTDLCAHHLSNAVNDYRRIMTEHGVDREAEGLVGTC